MGRLRRRRRSYKPLFYGLILFLIAVLVLTIIEHNLKPTILALAEARARQIATEAINDAINKRVVTNIEYRDLVYVRTDNLGRIAMMQPNTIKINKIASETTLEVQQTLQKLKGESFQIPLGQTLGSQLLASYGPRINVAIMPVGTVQVKVVDKFEEAGINQTRHMLYLQVESVVQIVVPLVSANVNVQTLVPIAENIIVGPVPNSYMNFNVPNFKN